MPMTSHRKRLRPVIRVFVSSTFTDLKQERDALPRDVFPELERFCQRQGFQFQAIDLRWGVPTEAGLEHRTPTGSAHRCPTPDRGPWMLWNLRPR